MRIHGGAARWMLVGLLWLTAAALPAVAAADGFPPALGRKLDAIVEDQMKAQGLPSVAVAIRVPGLGRYTAERGDANLRTGEARRLYQPFRIASITKSFTATAVLQLVDQGKIRKSDKLARWYPDFPNARLITVDDLLRMRSGIADSADHRFLSYYFDHPLTELDAEDMIRRAARRASEFTLPDQETVYTNVNYSLLERIVEKVSGRSLGEQIDRGIAKPLGLRHTFYPTGVDLPGTLRGYSLIGRTGAYRDTTRLAVGPAGGAGALISNIRDLEVYVRALCRGSLLKPATHQARLRGETLADAPTFVRYGEGVLQLGRFCGHNGTIFGFSSEAFYLPERDATIVINVNRLDEDDASKSTELFLRLTKALFPDLVDW